MQLVEPQFDLSEFSNLTYLAREGVPMKLKIPMVASPIPKVTWMKGEDDLVEDERVSVITTKISTSLVIKDVRTDDAGKYLITGQNIAGKKTSAIKIIVVGKPGPVYGHVHVTDVSAEEASITWTAPKEDGGNFMVPVQPYILEFRTVIQMPLVRPISEQFKNLVMPNLPE